MCSSSMMPTLTWFSGMGRFIAAIKGTMTRFRRSAWAPLTGLAVAVGDVDGCFVVSRDVSRVDGDAEPVLLVTPAQPPSSRASATATPSPWALFEINVARRIGLLLGSVGLSRQRFEEEVATPVAGAVAQRAVAEEIDVAVDDARVVGLVQQVADFRLGRVRRGGRVDSCGMGHGAPPGLLTSWFVRAQGCTCYARVGRMVRRRFAGRAASARE